MINRLFSAFFVRRLSLSRRVLALKDALRHFSAVHRNLIASYNIILEFLFRRIRLNCGDIQDAEITQGCAAERLISVRLRHPASKIESNASPNCIDFRYVFQCVCVCSIRLYDIFFDHSSTLSSSASGHRSYPSKSAFAFRVFPCCFANDGF